MLAGMMIVSLQLTAQNVRSAMYDAYMITRMAEKFHLQPKPLNDEFSAELLKSFITASDPHADIFLAEDIQQFMQYELKLDEEISQRKTTFLQLFIDVWKKRVQQNDSLTKIVCKSAFVLQQTDALNRSKQPVYDASLTARQQKIYKQLKWDVLDFITDIAIDQPKIIQQKKFLDSTELVFRKRLLQSEQKQYARYLGKADELLTKNFCVSVAKCYDPHTLYLPKDDKEEFDEGVGQTPLRFGLQVNEDENGNVFIDQVQPGSTAYKSGVINAGDKIIALQEPGKNSISTAALSLNAVDSLMQEIKSEKLLVTIKKPDGTTRQVTLLKERFVTEEDEEDLVQGYVLQGTTKIGYISIPDFYFDWENTQSGINGCANDVAKEIVKLRKENIQGLIIDIRYNGGGSLQEAIDLTGIFIDGGPVGQYKRREEKVATLKDVNSGSIFSGPLLVMVNGYSASASEAFSAALQDYNRALIVGSPTYGKSTGQVVLPLDTTITFETAASKQTEAYLKLTTFALYRVTGKSAQQHGVQPDILLPDLLQAIGEKERDQNNSFRLTTIEANKYYKAYPLISKAVLQTTSQQAIDTSSYFKKLTEYEQWYKSIDQSQSFAMNLESVFAYKQKLQTYMQFFEEYKPAHLFSVENHQMRKQRLTASAVLTESDNEAKSYISSDPYIQICYRLLQKMIKP